MPNLCEFIEDQEGVEAEVKIHECPLEKVVIQPGRLEFEKRSFELKKERLDDVARAIKVDANAYRRLEPEHQSALVDYERKQHPTRPLRIVTREDVVEAIERPSDVRIPPSEILKAVLKSFPDGVAADQLQVEHGDLSPTSLDCKIIARHLSEEVREGDVVSVGIQLEFPDREMPLPRTKFCVERLACLNGMTIREARDPIAAGLRSRLKEWDMAPGTILSGLRDCFRMAWNEAPQLFELLRTLQNEPVKDPELALMESASQLNLNDTLRRRLVQAYRDDEMGENNSRLGLVNAFTRLSTHGELPTGTRRRLESAAVNMLHAGRDRCPVCRSFFGRAAREN